MSRWTAFVATIATWALVLAPVHALAQQLAPEPSPPTRGSDRPQTPPEFGGSLVFGVQNQGWYDTLVAEIATTVSDADDQTALLEFIDFQIDLRATLLDTPPADPNDTLPPSLIYTMQPDPSDPDAVYLLSAHGEPINFYTDDANYLGVAPISDGDTTFDNFTRVNAALQLDGDSNAPVVLVSALVFDLITPDNPSGTSTHVLVFAERRPLVNIPSPATTGIPVPGGTDGRSPFSPINNAASNLLAPFGFPPIPQVPDFSPFLDELEKEREEFIDESNCYDAAVSNWNRETKSASTRYDQCLDNIIRDPIECLALYMTVDAIGAWIICAKATLGKCLIVALGAPIVFCGYAALKRIQACNDMHRQRYRDNAKEYFDNLLACGVCFPMADDPDLDPVDPDAYIACPSWIFYPPEW